MTVRLSRAYASHHPVLKEVLARDGWECWFCGGEFRQSGPLKPSIEHLVPRSSGGSSQEAENLAFAHAHCNTVAGDHDLDTKRRLRRSMRRAGHPWLPDSELKVVGVKYRRAERRKDRRKAKRRRVRQWQADRSRKSLAGLYKPLSALGDIVRREE